MALRQPKGAELKRLLKVSAIVVGLLVLLAAIAVAIAVAMGNRKAERILEIKVVPVPFAREPAALKLGKYLFETRGCAECHGADGRGIVYLDSPEGLYVKTPDITSGRVAWWPSTPRAIGCAPSVTA
jgi:hypothetical protein